jgi:hypothetical protein
MKNVFFILILSFTYLISNAQTDAYSTAMTKASIGLAEAKSPEAFTTVYNNFSRIAQANPNDWPSKYHATFALFMSGYALTESDMERGQKLIDNAQTALYQLEQSSTTPEQKSEVAVLQAYIHIGKLIENTMANGQSMTPLVFSSLAKAELLNPQNPRAFFIKGIFTLNMPAFIGGGVEAALPLFKKAKTLFEEEQMDGFNPRWGKEDNNATLNSITSKKANGE